MARLAGERDVGPGQHVRTAEAHLEESAAVEPAVRPERAAQRTRRGAEPRHDAHHRPARRGHRRASRAPRRPERPHAAGPRAGHRSVAAHADRMHAGRAPELAQEAQPSLW